MNVNNSNNAYYNNNLRKSPEKLDLSQKGIDLVNDTGFRSSIILDGGKDLNKTTVSEGFNIAKLPIENGKGKDLDQVLSEMTELERLQLAESIIKNGKGKNLDQAISEMTELERLQLAELIMKHLEGKDLDKFLDKMSESEHLELAKLMIEKIRVKKV